MQTAYLIAMLILKPLGLQFESQKGKIRYPEVQGSAFWIVLEFLRRFWVPEIQVQSQICSNNSEFRAFDKEKQ
jgi:hypothetical protein